ncbi:hypothetical protein AB4356_25675, partial [Vibrio lentus]
STLSTVVQLCIVILLIERIGVYALLIGLIASKVFFILNFTSLLPKKIEYDPDTLSIVYKKARSLVISSLYTRSGEVIDRYISGLLSSGSVSVLAFSMRVSMAITSVINS